MSHVVVFIGIVGIYVKNEESIQAGMYTYPSTRDIGHFPAVGLTPSDYIPVIALQVPSMEFHLLSFFNSFLSMVSAVPAYDAGI